MNRPTQATNSVKLWQQQSWNHHRHRNNFIIIVIIAAPWPSSPYWHHPLYLLHYPHHLAVIIIISRQNIWTATNLFQLLFIYRPFAISLPVLWSFLLKRLEDSLFYGHNRNILAKDQETNGAKAKKKKK